MIKIEFGGKRCNKRRLDARRHGYKLPQFFRLPRFAPDAQALIRQLPDIRQILTENSLMDTREDDGPAAISIPFSRLPDNRGIIGRR